MESCVPHWCRALVECAEAEGRVVLTSDAAFVAGRYCDSAYHVTGANKREQLTEARVLLLV